MRKPTRRYFASEPTSEFTRCAHQRIEDGAKSDASETQRELYADAWRAYYAAFPDEDGSSARILSDGEQDQLIQLRAAKARQLLTAYLSMLLGPQLTWRPQAVNSDADARAATILATQLLEERWKSGGMKGLVREWAENAAAFGEAYLLTLWDENAGEPLAVDESEDAALGGVSERVVGYEGDIRQEVVPPWRVVVDGAVTSPRDVQWYGVVVYRNRFDLAEAYGREADGSEGERYRAIIDAPARWCGELDALPVDMEPEADSVPLVLFFHRPTPSVPHGRFAAFVDGETCLWDVRLTSVYPGGIPLERLSFGDLMGTSRGYTPFWDMMAASRVRDDLISAAATNNTAGARQTLAVRSGADIESSKLGALNIITTPKDVHPRDAVTVLDTVRTPPETYSFIESLANEMQSTLGLNDVALGQPERGGSGVAYQLLAMAAVQQAQPQQSRIVEGIQRVGQTVLSILARHVSSERVLQVVGDSGANVLSESKWSGSQLRGVKRVIVDVGNPVEQTAAGRFELAQMYVKEGWAKSPEQVQQVLTTGRIEPLLQAERDQSLLIQAETQALQRGEAPVVHPLDNHSLHVREHASAVMSMDARGNPGVVEATWAHVAQHYLEYFGVPIEQDPMRYDRLQGLLGYPPPSMVAPPPMGPPGPGGPPMDGPPPGEVDPLEGEGLVDPNAPGLPGLPTNPMTGEQAAPLGGGPPLGI